MNADDLRFPEREIPEFELPEYVDLTENELRTLPESELLGILNGTHPTKTGLVALNLQGMINAEIVRRQVARGGKAHWTSYLALWISVGALFVALLAWLLPQS